MISLVHLVTFLASCTLAANTNADFVGLKASLVQYIQQNPSRKVPLLVRLSFHDLAGGLGPHGCIAVPAILASTDDAGLAAEVTSLQAFVTQRYGTQFSFGDVISLAGKAAVEMAFPCINVAWRSGRSQCSAIQNAYPLPLSSWNSMAQLQPYLIKYGMSANDFGVLLSGAHGVANAICSPANTGYGGSSLVMASINSGLDWIRVSFLSWGNQLAPNGDVQFIEGPLIRIPADMIYFPDAIETINKFGNLIKVPADNSTQAATSQAFLKTFLDKPRGIFDQAFSKVYANMLEIGLNTNDNMVAFVDTYQPIAVCPDSGPAASTPLPPFISSTTSAGSSTTTGSVTTTAAGSSTTSRSSPSSASSPSSTTSVSSGGSGSGGSGSGGSGSGGSGSGGSASQVASGSGASTKSGAISTGGSGSGGSVYSSNAATTSISFVSLFFVLLL